MLPVSEEATTGTATGHFVDKTEKSTGKHGTKRESRRCPSLYARLFGPITGTDGTVFIPSISRTDYRLCGKYGQKRARLAYHFLLCYKHLYCTLSQK